MVAIKEMKMPTKCSNCQILILLGYAVGCGGTNPHKLLEKDFLYRKPEWCPLVEVSEMSSTGGGFSTKEGYINASVDLC